MGRKGTTKNKGRKDIYDRFYTQPSEASRLLRHLVISLWGDNTQQVPADDMQLTEFIPDDVVFIEPSAGDGAFVKALEDLGIPPDRIIAVDIAPPSNALCKTRIIACDYLQTDDDVADDNDDGNDRNDADADEIKSANNGKTFKKKFDDVVRDKIGNRKLDPASTVIIGNPPFGEQGTLCLSFLYRSFELANIVSFVLPPSFAKESLKKKVGRSIISECNIIDDTYRINGETCIVPSAFFVYDATKPYYPIQSKIDELPFVFMKNSSNDTMKADFTIRRVGGNAGKASMNTNVSKQSNYFCRIKRNESDEPIIQTKTLIDIINSTEFPMRDKTVGPRSLSKDEIAWQVVDGLDNNG